MSVERYDFADDWKRSFGLTPIRVADDEEIRNLSRRYAFPGPLQIKIILRFVIKTLRQYLVIFSTYAENVRMHVTSTVATTLALQ